MSEFVDDRERSGLRVEADGERADALESLRHWAYFGEPIEPTGLASDGSESAGAVPQTQQPHRAAHAQEATQSASATADSRRSVLVPLVICAAVCLLIGAGAALFFSGYLDRSGATSDAAAVSFAVEVGEVVPSFRGYLLDPSERGPLFTQDDTVGRPLMIAAWHSDDPNAVAFLRSVTSLSASDAYADTQFLGLVLDTERDSAIDALIDSGAFAWSHLYNADPRLPVAQRPATSLNIAQTPALYYIDALGRLRASTIDPADLTDPTDTTDLP